MSNDCFGAHLSLGARPRLINLASPDPLLVERSVGSVVAAL
jgi:hypothetical protein